jgi:hypothetical protein
MHNSQQTLYGTIGGGYGNTILSVGSQGGTICGGEGNEISTYAGASFIGGGLDNLIYGGTSTGGTYYNVIVGGASNKTDIGASHSTIGGGFDNLTTGDATTIVGGESNEARGAWATALGGFGNRAGGDGAVCGGFWNSANGDNSVALGGFSNADGRSSVALGNYAHADQDGCFVFSDVSSVCDQTCTVNGVKSSNAFVVRAFGGVEFVTSATHDCPGTSTAVAGVFLPGGASDWSKLSDRNAKHGFQDVDTREVLLHVAAMPITTWSWNADKSGARHMGPMAQDFYAAFQLNDDDRHLTSIDEAGVAFAAIQGLYAEVLQRDEAIRAMNGQLTEAKKAAAEAGERAAALEKANAAVGRRLEALEKRLEQMEARLGSKR